MKTWEMIKAIADDDTKVFVNSLGSKVGLIDGILSWVHTNDRVQCPVKFGKTFNCNNLDIEWTEVQKQYTFEEAYEICKRSGTVFYSTANCNDKLKICSENGAVHLFGIDKFAGISLEVNWYKE